MQVEEIKVLINQIVKNGKGLTANSEYGDFLASVRKLAATVEHYSQVTDGKYPKLEAADYEILRRDYNDVIIKCDRFKNLIDPRLNKTKKAKNLSKLNKARIKLVEDFEKLVAADLSAIDSAPGKGERTYPEVLAEARGVILAIDGKDISITGDMQSARIPVSYRDEKGEVIKGFFTETEYFNFDREMQNIYNKAIEGHPEFERAFKGMMESDKFLDRASSDKYVEKFDDEAIKEQSFSEPIKKVFNMISPGTNDMDAQETAGVNEEFESYMNQLAADDEFAVRLHDFLDGYRSIYAKNNNFSMVLHLDEDSNISDRNVAVSEIASALGLSKLVAKSMKMKLIVDGVEKDGCFMEFADGHDSVDQKSGELFDRVDDDSLNNATILKNLADLQVMDFIAGNIDRHLGNMFYNLEDENGKIKVKSVVGIDNDCSMGVMKDCDIHTNGQMVSLNNMLVISEECADVVLNTTPDMLKLRLQHLELSNKEMEAACNRLCLLQNKILDSQEYFKDNPDEKVKSSQLKVVKKDEWTKYNRRELAYDEDNLKQYNYFFSIGNLRKTAEGYRNIADTKNSRKEKLESIFPKFAERKKESKMAEGKTISEMDPSVIRRNKETLIDLETKMINNNKGAFIGSPEYDAIIKQFAEVKELAKDITTDTGSVRLKKLSDEYRKLQTVTQKYLDRKNKQLEKNGELNDRSMKRFEFAKELKRFCVSRINGIDHDIKIKSTELVEYLHNHSNEWEEAIAGKNYTDELKENVAMVAVKRAFMDHPNKIVHLSINDFKVAVRSIQTKTDFNDKLHEGQPINVESILESVLHKQPKKNVMNPQTEAGNVPALE